MSNGWRAVLLLCLMGAMFAESSELKPRIIGGTPANANEHGYFVNLVYKRYWSLFASDEQYTLTTYCGASLIRDDLIITAAHCVEGLPDNGSIGVLIGNNASQMSYETCTTDPAVCSATTNASDPNLTGNVWIDRSLETSVIEIPASRVFVHPLYDESILRYDIALMRLESPVSSPLLKLPNVDYFSNYANAGGLTKVTAIGHGDTVGDRDETLASPALLEVDLTPRSNSVCSVQYGSQYDATNMICAGDPGLDSCQGDSGGPLIDANGYLLGLVSKGPLDCGTQTFGVYTDVYALKNWIESGAWNKSPVVEELYLDSYTTEEGEVVRMGAGSSGSELIWLTALLVSVRIWRKRYK